MSHRSRCCAVALAGPIVPGGEEARAASRDGSTPVQSSMNSTATWTAHTVLLPRRFSGVHGGQRSTLSHAGPIHARSTCHPCSGKRAQLAELHKGDYWSPTQVRSSVAPAPVATDATITVATAGRVPSPVFQAKSVNSRTSSLRTDNSAVLEVRCFRPNIRSSRPSLPALEDWRHNDAASALRRPTIRTRSPCSSARPRRPAAGQGPSWPAARPAAPPRRTSSGRPWVAFLRRVRSGLCPVPIGRW